MAFLRNMKGEKKALLNLTYSGPATFAPGTFDAETVEAEGITVADDGTQSVMITEKNAWLLASQTGKSEYVKFLSEIINDKYFDKEKMRYNHLPSHNNRSFSQIFRITGKI